MEKKARSALFGAPITPLQSIASVIHVTEQSGLSNLVQIDLYIALYEKLTVMYQLMSSAYQTQIVDVDKLQRKNKKR